MKTSLDHLPERHQIQIREIAERIVKKVRTCEMVILFGSFARGDYVEYDQRFEFGVRTHFLSDYDIMVLVSPDSNESTVRNILSSVREFFNRSASLRGRTLGILHEKIDDVNTCLRDGRYFYKDMRDEGVLLYDTGNYKLNWRNKPLRKRLRGVVQEYYDERFTRATDFFENYHFNYQNGKYVMASFMLHQTVENLYHTITLVFTLDKKKEHDLKELRSCTTCHHPELVTIFPDETEEDERLFELLRRAYVEARYNAKFEVTKEDLDVLEPYVKNFMNLVEKICTDEIAAISARTEAEDRERAIRWEIRARERMERENGGFGV